MTSSLRLVCMLLLISSLKLIAEIALLALLGQLLLGLLVGQRREQNVFYQLLQIIGKPFIQLARLLTPRVVLDRHLPLVVFFMLGFVWFGATVAKVSYCAEIGVELCK